MNSLRRWLYRPKRSDTSLLAQFFYADEDLNMVAAELDSFDGRKDPERCTALVNQLRSCQDKVLTAIQNIMDDGIPGRRASRDFRCKFPDDVIQENLAGQLWFGAECLAAGSSIMNREAESASMRPLARALTKNLDSLRTVLREQCLKNINEYTDRIKEALIIFDKLFAEFELSYVSAMVPVKTMKEYDTVQEITVLFSETVQRALKIGLLTQDMIDEYDPALMFTIPRLAIVSGLVVFREGPLNPDNDPWNMSDMFRPFQTLLFKIRELLYTLSPEEMLTLERALCSAEEPSFLASMQPSMESVEGFSQTDFVQLRSDKAEGTSGYTDQLGGPILVHTPNSGSPVTPVAQLDFPVGSISTSTSCATVIASSRQNSLEVEERQDVVECMLNKSESNDSGLHSENVSTSDSITTVSSTESQHHDHLLDNTMTSSPSTEEEVTLQDITNDVTLAPEATGLTEFSDFNSESADVSQSVRNMCAGIVNELVNTSTVTDSVSSSLSPSTTSSLSPSVSSSVSPSLSPSRSSVSSKPDEAGNESSSDSISVLSDSLNPSDAVCDPQPPISVPGNHSAIVTPSEQRLEPLPAWDQSSSSVISTNGETVEGGTSQTQGNRQHTLCSNTQETLRLMKPGMYERSTSGTAEKTSRSGTEMTPDRSGFPGVRRLRYEESLSSSCSSCKSAGDPDWEKMSCASSETSSYNSECHDDEEIALAMQAAELASRNEARSRFRSSSDMIHRLFVCISGVADQLQTNFASDLRNILRAVFDMNCGELLIVMDNKREEEADGEEEDEDGGRGASSSNESSPTRVRGIVERRDESEAQTSEPNDTTPLSNDPPHWIPDEVSPLCMACRVPFTFVRRRHHCRNCGKIFCGRCSSNSVPLPHYGHAKPVRVCNRCFMFQVTPFTVTGAA